MVPELSNFNATLPILNPAIEKQIGVVTIGNLTDINLAVLAASKALKSFSKTRKTERLALLQRLKVSNKARFKDLDQAVCIEMAAPISMAREAHADAIVGHLQGFIDALEVLDERVTLHNDDLVLCEPIGV